MQQNANKSKTSAQREIFECDAVPINSSAGKPVKNKAKPTKSISLYTWLFAIMVFLANRKFGIVFFIILLIYQILPKFRLGNIPKILGKIFGVIKSESK